MLADAECSQDEPFWSLFDRGKECAHLVVWQGEEKELEGGKAGIYHLVGIGGAGMSGIARILLQSGYKVTGSDLVESEVTFRLQREGAVVYQGHDRAHVDPRTRIVVVSSAVKSDNPEVLEARERGIPVVQRGEMLARIMASYRGIAVCGAHGKTTTTALIAVALERNGFDPTIIVGGELKELEGNARLGQGQYMVAEADESDGSFLRLRPFCTVVTNIENDHLDYYQNLENIIAAFKKFLSLTLPDGFSVVCWEDPILRQIVGSKRDGFVTYGFSPEADFWVEGIELQGLSASGWVFHKNIRLGKLELSIPGKHNLLNALAAVVVGNRLGVEFEKIAAALKPFRGVHRRFEVVGEIDGVMVVDDYAHHPTEIKATLEAARSLKNRRVVAVFQPHRYTRTHFLYREFGHAFGDADEVIVNEIYSAGEAPIPGVTARLIVEAIEKESQKEVLYFPRKEEIVAYLERTVRPGDLVLTLGAGHIWTVGLELVERLKSRGKPASA